jgi:hypothetical protein
MSTPHNRCFPIHFLSGIKICKMGTTIVRGFAYVKPAGFYPRCWWERWGYYRPHLEEIFSGFFLTITWPILVHLAWPRARFDRTREGYKMISSEIPQTCGLPVTNPTSGSEKVGLHMSNMPNEMLLHSEHIPYIQMVQKLWVCTCK